MENVLLKKLVLGTAIACSVFLGAREAIATPVEWGSFTNIVDNANNFIGETVNYFANSISFRDQHGNAITNNPKFSLVYLATFPEYGGATMLVGGLDGSGRSASGWFNSNTEWQFPGMKLGQTANQTEGNVDNGYWRMFVDLNGNGIYGTYDSSNGFFDFEEGEEIASTRVNNFQGFQTGVGTLSAGDISGVYLYQAPSVGILTSLSILSFTLQYQSSTVVVLFDVHAAGTNITACSFDLLATTNLSQSAWTTNASFTVTGTVTRVTATNTAVSLFFKVAE